MAISLIDWFKGKFGKSTPEEVEALFSDPENICAMAEAAKEMALLTCTDIIGSAMAKCEFKTFNRGKAQTKGEWRLWNIEPNANQDAQRFRMQIINRMISKGEALVVDMDGKLYIADSFTCDDAVVKDRVYKDVVIGDLSLKRHFGEREVMRFVLPSVGWYKTFDNVAAAYAQVINSGIKGYRRAQGMKGTLNIDAVQMQNEKVREAYETLKNAGFKRFADAESAVLPLYKGMEYTDVSQKTYSNQNSRDIRAMVDDLTDFAARMLGIPPVLVNGSVQDTTSAKKQFVGDCIVPLAAVIECEINRKRYSVSELERGNRLKVDTSRVLWSDWLSAAVGIDKLIASGIFCVNEVRELLSLPSIDEEWAHKHYLTKNYGDIEYGGGEITNE